MCVCALLCHSIDLYMTFRYQDSLPSLPVPSLEDTKARYERSVRALDVTPGALRAHLATAKAFFDGPLAAALQQRLEERAKGTRHWLEQWWNSYAYLAYRESIVVSNMCGV